jgi:alpha-glucosidase
MGRWRVARVALILLFMQGCMDPGEYAAPGETVAGTETVAVADTETGTETAPDAEAGTETAPDAEAVADTVAATDTDAVTDPGTVPDTVTEPAWSEGDCVDGGPAPAWVQLAAPGGSVSLSCEGFSLMLQGIHEGTVRLLYLEPGQAPPRSWVVAEVAGPAPEVTLVGTEAGAMVCLGGLRVEVRRASCRLRVRDLQGAVILEDPAGGGWFRRPGTLGGAETQVVGATRYAEPDEVFYGLGEKTGSLNRRGHSYDFWNTDTPGYAPDADPLYQSIPFLLGLRGATAWGLFTDNAHRLRVDVARADPEAVTVTAAGGAVDQYLIAGPRLPDVLERYTRLTGRPFLPPRWALGFHQSRWGYSSAEELLDIANELRARHLPADAVWLDIDYLDGYRSWTWDPVSFPDPAGLAASLEALGFALTVIIDPALKLDPGWPVYQAGLEGGHYIAGLDGQPFVGEVWPGAAVYPDFTRAATRQWWGTLVPAVTDAGVRGLWLDMNEPANFDEAHAWTLPEALPVDGDGVPTTMAEAHNVYALTEARATWEGMLAARPDRRPFLLTRAGFAGIQRWAAVWTGDANSDLGSLAVQWPMLLGLGLSGVPFVGSDVGGWQGQATPESYARWMAVGSVSPFFRAHCQTGGQDQEPWRFGPEVEEVSRAMMTERYRLLPYLYSLFDQARRTGAPILRPLVWDFPLDSTVRELSDQGLLGPWLLVAPVLQPGAGQRTLYLPEGRWFEARSGAAQEGPGWVTTEVTWAALPTYVREGAILPRGPALEWTGQAPTYVLELDLYPAAGSSDFTLYEDDGEYPETDEPGGPHRRLTWTLQGDAAGATLAASAPEGSHQPSPRRLLVRVHRVDSEPAGVALDGQPLARLDDAAALPVSATDAWAWDANDRTLLASVVDRPGLSLRFEYDPTLEALAPTVLVPVRVTLPAGTPHDAPVTIATSANGWTHQGLSWSASEPDVAEGLVPVPRGEWFWYKYARGGWDTVEKWAGCLEAGNRYAFGAAHPVKQDRVETWADWCRSVVPAKAGTQENQRPGPRLPPG